MEDVTEGESKDNRSSGIIQMKLQFHHINSLLFLCVLCFPIQAETLTGKVIKIADGDTVTILTENKQQERIRLAGIDAPERGQPFGTKAKQLLSQLVFEKTVSIEHKKRDRWGRIVGVIYLDDQDINLEIINQGLAWHYKKYQREQTLEQRKAYDLAERRARSEKRGLWQDKHIQPPWEWRKFKRTNPAT